MSRSIYHIICIYFTSVPCHLYYAVLLVYNFYCQDLNRNRCRMPVQNQKNEYCCLMSMEASRPVVFGTGTSGKEEEKSETSRQAATRKTKAAMHCHQNNKMLWQGPPGIVQQLLHHAVAVPTAVQNKSPKDNVRSCAVWKQLKQKKSNSQAQLHLPALDLFWPNCWVQHHLPPLDLACTRRSV